MLFDQNLDVFIENITVFDCFSFSLMSLVT